MQHLRDFGSISYKCDVFTTCPWSLRYHLCGTGGREILRARDGHPGTTGLMHIWTHRKLWQYAQDLHMLNQTNSNTEKMKWTQNPTLTKKLCTIYMCWERIKMFFQWTHLHKRDTVCISCVYHPHSSTQKRCHILGHTFVSFIFVWLVLFLVSFVWFSGISFLSFFLIERKSTKLHE